MVLPHIIAICDGKADCADVAQKISNFQSSSTSLFVANACTYIYVYRGIRNGEFKQIEALYNSNQ